MNLEGKIVTITGASAGIGAACAEAFAKEKSRLVLIARRSEKLKELSDSLFKKYGAEIYAIACDVTNYAELKKMLENLPDNWKNIDVLINNAGKARGLNPIQEGDLEDWEEMIDTNVKGLLYATRLILPGMVERKSGHIVNIGSIAGREAYPGGNVYCGTKAAVAMITRAMAIDLNGTNVKVTNVEPGLVETEFSKVRFHGDEERAKKVYEGYEPLRPEDIADVVLFAVSRPARVAIRDVLVTPTDQASATVVNKKR